MKIHLLGVNGPFPESGGATSGYLLEHRDTLIQFDFGSGILSRLTAKAAPESLQAIFLSHWHFDHMADLPVLMYRLQSSGTVLPVFAPEDRSSPLFQLISSAPNFRLTLLKPGDVLSFGDLSVHVGSARHPVPAVGFRISGPGGDWGYTGDTNTHPDLCGFYRGVRLLIADGPFLSDSWDENKPHLSGALAASLARDAGCDQLILSHLSPVVPSEALLREARTVFRQVSLARAGDVLSL